VPYKDDKIESEEMLKDISHADVAKDVEEPIDDAYDDYYDASS